MAVKVFFWIKPVRTVINRWVPNRRMIMGGPHRYPLIKVIKVCMAFSIDSPP